MMTDKLNVVIYIAYLMPFLVIMMSLMILLLDGKTWRKLDRMTNLFIREKTEMSGRLDIILGIIKTDSDRITKLEDRLNNK